MRRLLDAQVVTACNGGPCRDAERSVGAFGVDAVGQGTPPARLQAHAPTLPARRFAGLVWSGDRTIADAVAIAVVAVAVT